MEPYPPSYDYGQSDLPPRDGPSWEHREELGWFSAAFQTIKEVLFNPGDTFANARISGGLGSPLVFFMILFTVFGLIQAVINQMISGSMFEILLTFMESIPEISESDLEEIREGFEGQQYALPFTLVMSALLYPLGAILTSFIGAAINHVCLLLMGGANRDFEATFRAFCYTFGSIQAINLIPICGPMISWIWGLVVSIVALREVHETDTWRALIAVLLPTILCCCIFIFITIGILAMVGASGTV